MCQAQRMKQRVYIGVYNGYLYLRHDNVLCRYNSFNVPNTGRIYFSYNKIKGYVKKEKYNYKQ